MGIFLSDRSDILFITVYSNLNLLNSPNMASTKIVKATFSVKKPDHAIPVGVVKPPTGSTCEPTHVSLETNHQVIVVFKTKVSLKNVSVSNNEVVVTEGGSGAKYILVVLDQTDTDVWTIVIRTDKESEGGGDTFIAGTGLGVKS